MLQNPFYKLKNSWNTVCKFYKIGNPITMMENCKKGSDEFVL